MYYTTYQKINICYKYFQKIKIISYHANYGNMYFFIIIHYLSNMVHRLLYITIKNKEVSKILKLNLTIA